MASHDLGLVEIQTNPEDTAVVFAQVQVRKNFPTKAENVPQIWALDLTLTKSAPCTPTPADNRSHRSLKLWQHPQNGWARVLGTSAGALAPQPAVLVRFIFSSTNGWVVRSDFLERRFECCHLVSSVTSFLSPLQHVNATQPPPLLNSADDITSRSNSPGLEEVLGQAIGAIQAHTPSSSTEDLDAETVNRLGTFPWLVPQPLSPKRIAWVQGREDIDCIERALKAAVALGIKLVILDEPGHWLQDPHSPWAHLREAFIEVDIAPDEGFASRVAAAVKQYPKPIDGIVTISDVRLAGVAAACKILGLPTESPDAYEIAADKGRTRMLETVGAEESFVLPSADDLDQVLAQRDAPLTFPLVVKPVIGWSSDCVTKVRNEEELQVAVRKASDRHATSPKPSTAVVVEPYVAGPEVDANFVMLNGEILFADINDDFPSPADSAGAGFRANFQETQNVLPSALPAEELSAIQEQLRTSLLRQGFVSGIFHCEARVRNSSVRYGDAGDGTVDLVPAEGRQDRTAHPLEVYLHEVNARPPGYLESVAVLLAHGVDYYASRMLLALGPDEEPRFRALAHPFANGAQFHLSVMIIQQTRAGIMKSADAAKEFLERHPEVHANVVDYYTRKKAGDVLEGPDASSLWWIAFFSIVSRSSRKDLLKRVAFVEANFDYDLEPLES
ncbi:hypothetical protein QBC35DRAFT_251719 [Podospora australis]|uniref:ATP-grasp domain-containing protein n=1 Tax=Podospora australis TaxID=1536484 RepID=A0AAN7AH12_9PEZI|nr:hypothetical protein QBC35DRAFT_251719 [Podospora australis]